jgi:hypothetical protein
MTKEKTAKDIAEEKYPETTNEFKRLMNYQYEVFCKKMLDYGVDNICEGDKTNDENIRFSQIGIFFKLRDKVNRIKQLIVLNNEQLVENEIIDDTYQDLSNYSIIAQIVKNKLWGK